MLHEAREFRNSHLSWNNTWPLCLGLVEGEEVGTGPRGQKGPMSRVNPEASSRPLWRQDKSLAPCFSPWKAWISPSCHLRALWPPGITSQVRAEPTVTLAQARSAGLCFILIPGALAKLPNCASNQFGVTLRYFWLG